MAKKESAEKAIKDIRHKTRRRFSAEEKIRIVMEGLRAEDSVRCAAARRTVPVDVTRHSPTSKPDRAGRLQTARRWG